VPQYIHICRSLLVVLGHTDAIELFGIVQPVDIRMSIVRITSTAKDFATLYGPEIRDDIHVMLNNVEAHGVYNGTVDLRLHP
jgi:hypothetical protein